MRICSDTLLIIPAITDKPRLLCLKKACVYYFNSCSFQNEKRNFGLRKSAHYNAVKRRGTPALGTECALNVHSIRIDRICTRNVKVPNRIECALSQSTYVCESNPVRSGLVWNVGGRSFCHMIIVLTYIHGWGLFVEPSWCLLVGILQRRRLCRVYWGDADV